MYITRYCDQNVWFRMYFFFLYIMLNKLDTKLEEEVYVPVLNVKLSLIVIDPCAIIVFYSVNLSQIDMLLL